jgi:DNA-binding transcriptional ArsR family regulator/ubiquinone/menaquinone biosynthesis C-methylase UbiE
MSISTTVALFRAAGDPTRLRLLALLAGGEVTVGELVEILGQSQPRVSRHLKLLADAGLVTHFRDGQWVYYRLRSETAVEGFVLQAIELARAGDGIVEEDRTRFVSIRSQRERTAHAMPTGPRRLVDPTASRPTESALTAALNDALGSGPIGDLLDVGTGSGTILRLLGPRAHSAVGVDAARGMRVLARSRIHEAGLAHCTIREGDVQALPFPDLSFDVIVLDEVLALVPQPALALQETLRTLKPAGQLIILDRVLPAARRLPGQAPHRCLYENQLKVMLLEAGLQVSRRIWFAGKALEYALFSARATGVVANVAPGTLSND